MDTKRANQIKRFTERWYGTHRHGIPELGTKQFTNFAAQSAGFVSTILNSDSVRSLKVRITEDATASIDIKNRVIRLPQWYFQSEAISAVMGTSSFESIVKVLATALINGSVIHESYHMKYSPADLIGAFKSIGHEDIVKRYGQTSAMALNLVEDLYIERRCWYNQPAYYEFVSAKNDILFNEEALQTAADAFQENPNANTATQFCFCLKSETLRDHEAFNLLPSEAYALMKRITSSSVMDQDVRTRLAVRFLEMFEPDPEAEASTGSAEVDSLASMISSIEKAGEELSKLLGGLEESLVEAFAKAFDEAKAEASDIEEFNGEAIHKPIIKSIMDMNDTYRRKIEELPQIDSNYSFVQGLIRLRTKNHTPGEACTRGSRVVNTRLYRIATDGKICANTENYGEQQKDAEWIIELDASGSMRGPSVRIDDDNYVDFYTYVVAQGMAIHNALRKAGIPNKVVAHTSIDGPLGGNKQPIIYEIASYNMNTTTSQTEERFLKAANVDTQENFDGFIHPKAATLFTKRPGRKVLLVLSDGEPSAPDYRGSSAHNHTKEEVKKLRKQGYDVICMSLIDDVVETNSAIYGKEYNIDATGNLKQSFERVIENIQREVN